MHLSVTEILRSLSGLLNLSVIMRWTLTVGGAFGLSYPETPPDFILARTSRTERSLSLPPSNLRLEVRNRDSQIEVFRILHESPSLHVPLTEVLHGRYGNACLSRRSGSSEWPREAELVTVRVADVEVAFAPFGVARSSVAPQPLGDAVLVQGVHVRDIEDHPTPPGPLVLQRLSNQVHITRSGKQASKGCPFAAVADGKTERTIEPYGACHIMGRQADGADGFDS